MTKKGSSDHLDVTWVDMHREPQCDPDPAYPEGKFVDASLLGMPNCQVDLPYPAKRIGHYEIVCRKCGKRVFVTTAGRPDDPTGVKFSCKRSGAEIATIAMKTKHAD